jgi:hypothetical protein
MPTINKILLVLAVIATIVLIVTLYLRKPVEGFGVIYPTRQNFSLSQTSIYAKRYNRALFTNSGLEKEISGAVKAFAITDTLNNSRNAPTDISHYFDKDPFPGLAERNQKCAGVLEPRFLPARDILTKNGCGWWYIDDANRASVGADGTELGPYANDHLEKTLGGGKWVWDLEKAQKMEDIKRCRKIRSCEVSDLVPGRCGFCPPLSRGVPIRSDKSSPYPNDPALNCGSEVITNPSKCPRPQLPVIVPGQAPTFKPTPLICDPNPATGKLTAVCLISLAKGAGCSEGGAIISILQGDNKGYYREKTGQDHAKFTIANRVIKQDTGIVMNVAFIGDGTCSRSEALGFYNTIVKLAANASTKRARAAAGFMATGVNFDECENATTDTGPFELHCLQRTAREAGCQPDGTEFPVDNNKGKYDAMSWGGVFRHFADIREGMNSADIDVQALKTKQCLGITIVPPKPDCGDTAGLSYYCYEWNYDSSISSNGAAPASIYYGRVIKETFPEINNNGVYTPFGIGTDRIYMRFKGKIASPTTLNTRFWVYTDDGIAITGPLSSGINLLQKWWDQGPTAYESSSFVVPEGRPYPFILDWFNNYGGYVMIARLWLNGTFQNIPAPLIQQEQPTGFPIARWDFYEGMIHDRCMTLRSNPVGNIQIGSIAGKKCGYFTGNTHIKIQNGIRTTAFKSITMTIYIRSYTGPWPRPWEFNNRGFGSDWCGDAVFGCMSPGGGMGWGFYAKQNCGGPEMWTGGGSANVGKWYHLAWVFDDDMMGMSTYVDGTLMKRQKSEALGFLQGKIYRNMYIMNSVEQFEKDVGVGWFRMFDYTMSPEDIRTDRMNGWSTKDLFPVSEDSGWAKIQVPALPKAPPQAPPPPRQITRGNNGSVTCQRYCQGISGKSWNGELPQDWNGAKCAGTPEAPATGCNTAPGVGVACLCEKTGTGWL